MKAALLHDRASVHDDHVNVRDGRESENGKTVEVSKKFLPRAENGRVLRRTFGQAF
jgi:hypothetical protein